MKKKFIKLTEKEISKLCKDAYTLIRSSRSYNSKRINKRNVELFLLFLDYSFEKPYNRLSSLAHFINHTGQIRIDQMYPFGLLTNDVKELILKKSEQATNLGCGLDASGIDPNFVILWKEERFKGYDH